MKKDIKRYGLVLPEELFAQVKNAADKRGDTTAELLRRFIRLGLDELKAEEGGGCLVVRKDGRDTELKIV